MADDGRNKPDAWQAALDFGIDVTLLEENLRRTPAERLQQLTTMSRSEGGGEGVSTIEELRAKFGDLLDHAAPDGKRCGSSQ